MKRLLLLIAITFLWLSGFPQATKTLINSNGVYTITPNQYVLAADTFYFAAIGDTTNTLLGKTRASQIYATKAENALKLAIADTNHFAHISDTTGATSIAGATWVGGKFATIANLALKLAKSDTTSFLHWSDTTVLGTKSDLLPYLAKADTIHFLNEADTINIIPTYTDIVNTAYVYAADAGSSDAYAITIPGFKGFVTGQVLVFYANTANTGACTLAVNGGTAKDLKSLHDQDPADNYIEAGSMVTVIYDGTSLQIVTPDANP